MSDLKEGGGRGRGTKRKLEEKAPGGKKSKGELSTPPLPSNGYPKVLLLEALCIENNLISLENQFMCPIPGAPVQPRRLQICACRARPSCAV